jgi:NAD(P)-dependent dehydrogenase (short-subunit alcohol dehydrogenase family)
MSGPRKTAIVTGASQGIGAGIVKGFVERGFNVVANSRKVTQSTEVAASNHVALVDGHIGEPATAARIVATAPFRFKSIDALVNNAGIFFDGGYGEYMVAPVSAVARFPDGLSPAEAAPLLCAGVTTFNALRNSGARPGDVVAVLGLGGLGQVRRAHQVVAEPRELACRRGRKSQRDGRRRGRRRFGRQRAGKVLGQPSDRRFKVQLV